jgi:hypothetical protein
MGVFTSGSGHDALVGYLANLQIGSTSRGRHSFVSASSNLTGTYDVDLLGNITGLSVRDSASLYNLIATDLSISTLGRTSTSLTAADLYSGDDVFKGYYAQDNLDGFGGTNRIEIAALRNIGTQIIFDIDYPPTSQHAKSLSMGHDKDVAL